MCDLSGILVFFFYFEGRVESSVGKDGVFIVCLVST